MAPPTYSILPAGVAALFGSSAKVCAICCLHEKAFCQKLHPRVLHWKANYQKTIHNFVQCHNIGIGTLALYQELRNSITSVLCARYCIRSCAKACHQYCLLTLHQGLYSVSFVPKSQSSASIHTTTSLCHHASSITQIISTTSQYSLAL